MRNLLLFTIVNIMICTMSFAQSPEIMRALESASEDEFDIDNPVSPGISTDDFKTYDDIQIKLYPNPVSGMSTWVRMTNLPNTFKTIEVMFTDAFGSILLQDKRKSKETFFEYRIGMLERLNAGVYHVRVTVDHITMVEKLIIE